MNLKDLLESSKEPINEQSRKSSIKKLEKMANRIILDMEKFNKEFKSIHKVNSSEPQLYDQLKEWESLTRDIKMKFGGWFGFVYDSDFIKK